MMHGSSNPKKKDPLIACALIRMIADERIAERFAYEAIYREMIIEMGLRHEDVVAYVEAHREELEKIRAERKMY